MPTGVCLPEIQGEICLIVKCTVRLLAFNFTFTLYNIRLKRSCKMGSSIRLQTSAESCDYSAFV